MDNDNKENIAFFEKNTNDISVDSLDQAIVVEEKSGPKIDDVSPVNTTIDHSFGPALVGAASFESTEAASAERERESHEQGVAETLEETAPTLSEASAITQREPEISEESHKMEFTKNYSDDLLMGQSDGAQQGEMQASGVDLADFELPPYSGSSSGSEPRQHSPAKRKSSSSSTHAQQQQQQQQASSSHQVNVAPPNLSAVKELLLSSFSRVSHLFYWRNPVESGVIFALGLGLITALTFFSIILVVAYSALGVISASGLIRLYKMIMKTLNRSPVTPFDHIWDKVLDLNVSLSPAKMHELLDASLGNLNASLVYFKQVLLVGDKFATIKFSLFLYSLTYIGTWFNGMTLITMTYLGLFSVPLLYEKNKTKIDEYINLATSHISSTISIVTNKTSSAFSSTPVATSTSDTKKQN